MEAKLAESIAIAKRIEAEGVSGASRSWLVSVIMLLGECMYEEDVREMRHFVLHQRLNQVSSACLLCHCGTDGCLPNEGHDMSCPYAQALRRTEGSLLSDYVDRN